MLVHFLVGVLAISAQRRRYHRFFTDTLTYSCTIFASCRSATMLARVEVLGGGGMMRSTCILRRSRATRWRPVAIEDVSIRFHLVIVYICLSSEKNAVLRSIVPMCAAALPGCSEATRLERISTENRFRRDKLSIRDKVRAGVMPIKERSKSLRWLGKSCEK